MDIQEIKRSIECDIERKKSNRVSFKTIRKLKYLHKRLGKRYIPLLSMNGKIIIVPPNTLFSVSYDTKTYKATTSGMIECVGVVSYKHTWIDFFKKSIKVNHAVDSILPLDSYFPTKEDENILSDIGYVELNGAMHTHVLIDDKIPCVIKTVDNSSGDLRNIYIEGGRKINTESENVNINKNDKFYWFLDPFVEITAVIFSV